MAPAEPPRWSDEELQEDRLHSREKFIDERPDRSVECYLEVFEEKEALIENLLALTNDLNDFSGEIFVENPDLVEPARHITGPPISQDNLDAFVGGKFTRRKNIDADVAEQGATIIAEMVDPERFPWMDEDRTPTDGERALAVKSTAAILADKTAKTDLRNEDSKRQEQAAIARLQSEGLSKKSVGRIDSAEDLDKLPPGTFGHRVDILGSECDIPVRLSDGRLLAIEGKVSNSEVNSIKRLNREVGDKASTWRDEFGDVVIPAALLSGLYKLNYLKDAQDTKQITIFWDHNLDSLIDFIAKVERGESGGR